ncbi:MAG: bifunctional nuclease family protein [Acidimicrobiia bacterium]|nr:bifunctional nuclease family protein [Acidimicrobiia bacterium]
MIEMTLVGVRVELPTNQPIVLLRESDGERFLPIWIGGVEAQAIAFALQGTVTPRPLTHDLMRDIIEGLEITVSRVVICDLRDGTFYADLVLENAGKEVTVSARPSDAIALAVRIGAPLFAAEEVLDEASILIDEDEIEDADKEDGEEDPDAVVEEFREFLEDISPEDFES